MENIEGFMNKPFEIVSYILNFLDMYAGILKPVCIVLGVIGIVFFVIGAYKLVDGDSSNWEGCPINFEDSERDSMAERIEYSGIPFAEGIASVLFVTQLVAWLMYYPSLFLVGLFCTLSGSGNAGIFSLVVNEDVAYRFSNYLQWEDAPKYLCAFIVIKLIMRIVGNLFRLRPIKLLRTLAYTVDAAVLGMVIGFLYTVLEDASRGNFLMTLVSLIVGVPLYMLYPLAMIGFILPLLMLASPVIVVLLIPLQLICIILGGAAGIKDPLYEDLERDALEKGNMTKLKALMLAEAGKTDLWLVIDIFGM